MNRSEFMDFLLEKGECNRFDEHQIDALEQFCFALYENTELDKPTERIAELEEVLKLVRKDLLMRAEEESDGCKVVDLSSFIWTRLNEVLEEQGK